MTNSLATTQTGDLVQSIIERILNGSSVKEATKECGIDVFKFNRMLQQDRQAAQAYARAVEIRADVLADEALHIADNEADSSKARNQIQVRQWLASKLYAKRYGDRIDLNVTQTIDIGSTLAEARSRLLPVRDQHQVIDVEPRMNTGLSEHGATDNESVAPPTSSASPDIFS